MLTISYAHTEPSHPDGEKIIELLSAAKGVKLVKSDQRAGDYTMVSSHGQSLGIEYKTVFEFYDSVISERLDFQIPRLALDYDVPVIVLKGTILPSQGGEVELDRWQIRHYPYTTLQRKLVRLQWAGVSVLMPGGLPQVANTILGLCRSLEGHELEPLRERPSRALVMPEGTHDQQAQVLADFPGVGSTVARAILKEYRSLGAALRSLMSPGGVPTWHDRVSGVGPETTRRGLAFLRKEREE